MTLILCGKKLKIGDVNLFGQVRVECKCLKLDSNPSLTANSFLLSIILCYISEKVIQTHIFFQKHSRQQGHFKTQVPPGNLSHLSKFLAQLIYKSPLSITSSPSHFFKVCHSPLRWQAEGWWWECGNIKFINRRGCQEWTRRGSQRTHVGESSPSCFSICANYRCVCIPTQNWP